MNDNALPQVPTDAMVTGERSLHWRGINHLALVTTDMDATVRFYHGVLEAPLVTLTTPITDCSAILIR